MAKKNPIRKFGNNYHLNIRQHKSSEILKISSSFFALLGGILLASNTEISAYGFILLAMSSSQMLIANLQIQDKTMILYAGSVFLFVDCLGVYRWLLS
ncbi:hypothetical protein [Calothrix sp. PCC 6303]|uniref:hypothetical protein n=1 Tax=Calothrix sp. PCC 6303 TaxID=1170562 RepID=UPI0002A03A0C|nr:hypothetical protein [Calothrix sp. PCC 6303]AFY99842.1 hypothetical protein Cal6303_0776 [Calothrix sp. PCC 6303]